MNAGFGDSGGVYHSIYDSFDWYTRFSDKDFSQGKALDPNHDAPRLCAWRMRRFFRSSSEQSSRPFEGYLADLSKQKELQLSDLHAEVGKLQTAAEAYEKTYQKGAGASGCPAKAEPLLSRPSERFCADAGFQGGPSISTS